MTTENPITFSDPDTRDQAPSEHDDDPRTARARRAERQAAALESELATLRNQLEHSRADLAEQSRSHELDLALSAAGAIDYDTARLLADRTSRESPETSPRECVAQLVRKKPFLFRPAPSRHSAMSARSDDSHGPLLSAAERAAATGDRAALLDYLRARRSA